MSTDTGLMYEWNSIPWPKLERKVFKLQKRIYQASQGGDNVMVHRLQRLLVCSAAARLIAVRRVSQDNQGKKTAGVDGVKALAPARRLSMAKELSLGQKADPVRRVWIPKPGKTEKRPLGIPTMQDRARQTLVRMALEPQWEARFEPNSYGFRPGRSCHDAIEAVRLIIRQQPKYVLDADIAGCFDHIDHGALLQKLDTYPRLRRLIRAWLKAGVVDGGELFPTEEGTPQGGAISPLLANVALHGLEQMLTNSYPKTKKVGGVQFHSWTPKIVRYADDFVIFHSDRKVVEDCRERVQSWLTGIGLELKPSKTRLAHTLEAVEGTAGFDFLGCEFRQFLVAKFAPKGGKRLRTIIRPSKRAVQQHYGQLKETIADYMSLEQEKLIARLNPIIRGWANYYRTVNSRDAFGQLRCLVFTRLWRWAKRRHSHKPRSWLKDRYFNRGEPWLFRGEDGVAVLDHGAMRIVKHIKVKGTASPYDGNWPYWATRRGHYPNVPTTHAVLLRRQDGRCAHCSRYFVSAWETTPYLAGARPGRRGA